jgi:membrane protein
MNPDVRRAVSVAKAIVHEIRVERVTFMAGSIAYNAFVSLLPLLLLLIAAVSTLGSQRLEETLLGITNAAVTPGAGEVLVQEVRTASTQLSLLGGAFLLWGALRIFRSLDAAFSDIYETAAEETLPDQLLDGVVVFLSMSAVVLVVTALETQLPTGAVASGGWLLQRLLLAAGVAVTLVPMYYLFPDEDGMALVEVVPGVCVTAVGLVVFQSLFQLYLEFSTTAARESILASILVFMTWLYFSGLIILVGAAVNAVLSNRSADVNIEPVVGGVAPDDDDHTVATADDDTVEALERLEHLLPAASSLEVVVDGESISLPVPAMVETDLDTLDIPLVEGTVDIELSWTVDEGDLEDGSD